MEKLLSYRKRLVSGLLSPLCWYKYYTTKYLGNYFCLLIDFSQKYNVIQDLLDTSVCVELQNVEFDGFNSLGAMTICYFITKY